MGIFEGILILAAILCSLVAGFLFAFAVVVMPGIGSLADKEFLRAFQVMDRVIQNNQPLFMLVWVGSILALIISAVLGFRQLDGLGRLLIVVATAIYLIGVQVPTVAINIPLNNNLQKVDVKSIGELAAKEFREEFEPRWNRSNVVRTLLASVASVMLIAVLYRL